MIHTPAPEYTIRPVTAELVNVDLGPTSQVAMPEGYTSGLGEAIDAGNISFYVAATAAGEAVGRVGVNWQGPSRAPEIIEALPGVPNVAFMEVHGDHRRRGIARALLRAVFDDARERGRDRLFLSVGVDDEAYGARELYRQEGFEPWALGTLVVSDNVLDKETRTYTAVQREVIIMTKDMVRD